LALKHDSRDLTQSPEALDALARKSSWRFENAHMRYRGEMCRVAEIYADALAQLRTGTDDGRRQAAEMFQAILTSAPEFAEGHFQLARIYAQSGEMDEAQRLAANAAAMAADNINYLVLHVAMLASHDRIEAASRTIRNFSGAAKLDIDPQAPDERLVTRFVDDYLALVLPGHALLNGRLCPLNAVIDDSVAELRDQGGKPESAAAERLRQVLNHHPAWAEARFWLAETARRNGNLDGAIALCQDGERLRKMDWPLWLTFGLAEAERGNIRQALGFFEEAALVNEHLPAHAPNDLTESGARSLVAWYKDVLDAVPIAPGAYSRPWRYPEFPEIELRPRDRAHSGLQLREALRDITAGIAKTSAWWTLARNDVLARYRRTFLGPWWTVAGTGIGLVGMALVWSVIFNMSAAEFFPYLASGYTVWLFLASTMTEGCTAFTDGTAQSIQRNMDLPRFIHVMRLVVKNTLLLLHTLTIYIVGALIFGVSVTPATLLVIPGMLLLFANAAWTVCLFGIAGARYRDLAPAIGALLTVTFFVTPVIWKADMLRDRAWLADWNPFTHLIAIVRDPLLGTFPPAISWQVALGICAVGWIASMLIYARTRRRIVYWL
jgi:ABC-2 type transport system permease protein